MKHTKVCRNSLGIINKQKDTRNTDNTNKTTMVSLINNKRISQAAPVAIARLPLFLASRFYIEFIINANTISVISYTYAHISGESLCTSRYIQLFTIPSRRLGWRETRRKLYIPAALVLKIISDATVSRSVFCCFSFFFYYKPCNFYRHTIHPRTSTIGIDETGKSHRALVRL